MTDDPPRILASSQPDLQLLARLEASQTACLEIVSLIAVVILCAWLIPALAALLPTGWSLMKPDTALCILLAVASLWLSRHPNSPGKILAGRVLGGVMVLISVSALYQYLGGSLSSLLAHLTTGASDEYALGRMSFQTALFFLLLGTLRICMQSNKNVLSLIADVIAATLVLMSLIVFSGYCFGASHFFGETPLIVTSPHTLFSMVLLTFVSVSRRAEYGLFSVLLGIGIGSRIARITLPLALAIPFLLAIGRSYSVTNNWISGHYAAALTASVSSALFSALLLLMAWRINSLERELRDMSLSDELTGIYNHRGFYLLGEQALRESQRSGSPLMVLFFDLDDLKKTNDTLGHDLGSRLLRDMATLLRDNFRDSDIVARVGGDEFAVVTHVAREATQLALQRLHDAVDHHNDTAGQPYKISYSVGETHRDADTGLTFSQMVRQADAQMYQRKREKKLRAKR
ncbi:MAG TPA: GGDEF domain-containing protein [Stenotrophobium sp.]|jgi:diguanylate cyclase (GGDEF)-like protein|nr:GGDEF domain-containing protein [Stenotrophobium sp.]